MAWHDLAFDGTTRERLGVDAGHFRGEDHGMLLDSGLSDTELLTSWREVAGAVFAAALPSPLVEPTLVCHSTSALLAIGVAATPTAAELGGNELPAAALPAAHCYAGHQFGNYAGQLGDGAAVSLGEVVTPSGELRELGLKGAGPTPFTRAEAGTGRKQLGAMVVELLVAEALAALGVPTSRGLGVVAGMPAEGGDDCAVLARTATCFLRFGSFEVCLPHHHDRTDRHAPSAGDTALLRRLADFCIASHFPRLAAVPDDAEEEDEDLRAAPRYGELVLEIARRTARLAAAWQLLGACHGMLNTDNLSVAGETLDHGSFAFMDHARCDFAGRYSLQDDRYRCENQPAEARRACERLAEALQPLHCTRPLEMRAAVARAFEAAYGAAYAEGMRSKLGLREAQPALALELVRLMFRTGADWSGTFRLLSCGRPVEAAEVAGWCEQPDAPAWAAWLARYAAVLATEDAEAGAPPPYERAAAMRATNPAVVPRRWLLDRASAAAEAGDYPEVERLLQLLTHPFEEPPPEPLSGAEARPPPARASVVSGGVVPPVDAARLGPAGPRAVEALEDAGFWRRLCPELTVLSPASAGLAERATPFRVGEARLAALRASMRDHGHLELRRDELPWSVDLGALARGIESLHAAGWPPAFIMAYDEAWLVAAQMAPLLEQLTGNPLSFDWMAFRVAPGQPGFPPHRDKGLGLSGESGLRADGTARYNTCWIALVDVPHTSSCLMCVPRGHDPGYLASSDAHNPVASAEALCHVQPLPLAAGGAAVFSHRLFHWSRGGNAHTADGAPAPARFALAITAIDESYDVRYLPQAALPLPPLPIRVALAAGQVFAYSNHERSQIDAELLWACFLAMSHHFYDSWVRRVFQAKHR